MALPVILARIVAGLVGRGAAARTGAAALGEAAGGQTAKSMATGAAKQAATPRPEHLAAVARWEQRRRISDLERKKLAEVLQKLANKPPPTHDQAGTPWKGNVQQLLTNRLEFLASKQAPPVEAKGFRITQPSAEHRKAVELWMSGKGPPPEPGRGPQTAPLAAAGGQQPPIKPPAVPAPASPIPDPPRGIPVAKTLAQAWGDLGVGKPGTAAPQGPPPPPPKPNVFRQFFDSFKRPPDPRPAGKPGFFEGLKGAFQMRMMMQGSAPPTGQGDGPQAREPAQPRSFAGLASQSKNFGALLSGGTTPEAVNQEADDQQQQQQQKEQEAKRAGTDALKTLGKAAAGSAVAMLLVPPALKKFSEALLDSRHHLAQFNGKIAEAFSRLQAGDIRRSRLSGAATAESTVALAESVNSMRDELRPINDAVSNITNLIAAGGAVLVKNLAEGARTSRYTQWIYEWLVRAEKPRFETDPWTKALMGAAEVADQRMRQNLPLTNRNQGAGDWAAGLGPGGVWPPQGPQQGGRQNPPLPPQPGDPLPGGGAPLGPDGVPMTPAERHAANRRQRAEDRWWRMGIHPDTGGRLGKRRRALGLPETGTPTTKQRREAGERRRRGR